MGVVSDLLWVWSQLSPLHTGMVKEIHGSYKVPYHPVEGDAEKVFEVDWSPPFRRVYMIPELEKCLNVTFPPPTEFDKPGEGSKTKRKELVKFFDLEFTKFLDELLVKNNVECSPPRTAARMLDKVSPSSSPHPLSLF